MAGDENICFRIPLVLKNYLKLIGCFFFFPLFQMYLCNNHENVAKETNNNFLCEKNGYSLVGLGECTRTTTEYK